MYIYIYIFLGKKSNGAAMRTGPTVGSNSRSPTPSSMEGKHSRFAMLGRIFKPWKWKRKKKSDKFEQTSRSKFIFLVFNTFIIKKLAEVVFLEFQCCIFSCYARKKLLKLFSCIQMVSFYKLFDWYGNWFNRIFFFFNLSQKLISNYNQSRPYKEIWNAPKIYSL